MPETIWSNGTPGSDTQLKSMLDHVDPDVANMFGGDFSGSDFGEKEFSRSISTDKDIDGKLFGVRPSALSAISAPDDGIRGPSGPHGTSGPQGPPGPGSRLGFGAASISGGITSRHPPQDSFLQKFSNVGDATREIELSNNFSSALSFEGLGSRRTSFHTPGANGSNAARGDSLKHPLSDSGSLNESLNINNNRTSRHQSISEKIDHYNNTSPIQAGATLSMSPDYASAGPEDSRVVPPPQNPHMNPANIWNPAAASFFPPYGAAAGVAAGDAKTMPPPAAMPPPFMDPRFFNFNYMAPPRDEKPKDSNESPNSRSKKSFHHTPGLGMPNAKPNPGAMFQPFNPYLMYQPMMGSETEVTGPMGPMGPQGPPGSSGPMGSGSRSGSDPSSLEAVSPANASDVTPTPLEKPTPPANNRRKGAKNGKASAAGNGGPHIYRSPLLEEVRSNFKGKDYYLKDIYGHAVEFTKDQHGSRFIQQKLPEASDEEKEMIFNEIRDISYDLMTDVFGNYVIQKYFEHGSTTQKQVLLEYMMGHIYDLSLQMYGCRVVQRALEAIDLSGQIRIVNELKNHVLICAKDQNGNHVIQKSIERIPFEHVRFILDSLENQIYHLSTHPYGCRVIQRFLEHSNKEDQRKILNELYRFIFYLIQDQYGNYVMQHILERGSSQDRDAILKIVLGSVVNFSKHKFASNVIEKCIKYGDLTQRKRILGEVLLGNEDLSIEVVDDDSPLALMMKDQYANYVIQKLVEGFGTKSEEKKVLVLKLRQYLKQISSKNSYGKHLASVEKMIIVAETALIQAENS